VTSADAARLLREFLAALDVPSVDGFNTWLVSSLAHDAGAKTVLSGLGGDELFGSYPSFARVPMMVRGVSVVGWGQPVLRMGGRALARFGTSARMQRMGEFLQGSSTVDNAYHAYRGIFPHRDAVRLAAFLTGTDEAALRSDRTDAGDAIPSDARDAVSYLELTHYMRNQLLRDSDVMSMAHGLELRVPFVDAALFDAVARIAPDLRYEVGKRLLIDAVPEVPEFVRHKSKRGFTLPFEKWLQGALGGPVAASSSTGLPVEAREWYQRWSLFIFHQWRERVLGESP
jgi:asparagine synthase (glutamine-hydrolysing)